MASGILAPVLQSADDASHSFEAAGRPGNTAMPAVDHASAVSAAVETTLSNFLAREAAALQAADPALSGLASLARSYVLACGKRLRPTFAYWGWRGVAGLAPPLEAVLPALAGLELLHAFALVQDDVMDGSTTRRGRATAHEVLAAEHAAAERAGSARRFGSAGAVLLGDLLLVWADRMQFEANVPAAALLAARRHYDEMRIATIAGQYLDVLSDAESNAWSVERALRVARLKTAGYTVTGPLLLGAALAVGEVPDRAANAYTIYGEAVGEAFQLRDDLLGVFGDPAVTGKPAGDDLREGKRTLLLALAVERAVQRGSTAAVAEIEEAVGDPELDDARLDRVRDLLDDLGAVQAVEQRIAALTGSALDALGAGGVAEPAASRLADLAVAATRRRR